MKDGVSRAIIKLDNEVSKMTKFKDDIYAITNYNTINMINIPNIEVYRSVVFSDSNITAIYSLESSIMFADHMNKIFVYDKTNLEVRNFLFWY